MARGTRDLLVLLTVLAHASTADAQVRNDTFRVFTIHSPAEIARTDTVLGQAPHLGGQPPDMGITARLVHVQDTDGGHLACDPPMNAAQLAGQIALIQRGDCQFGVKARNVEDVGALAFVVYQDDRVPDANCDAVLMAWEEPLVTITGAFLPRCVVVAILPTVVSGEEITATLAPVFEGTNPSVADGPSAPDPALIVSPNPASSVTALTVRAAASQRLRAEVRDALGRHVVTLHDGIFPGGTRRFLLDAGVLPPGVYHFRTTTEGDQSSRRFVVRR